MNLRGIVQALYELDQESVVDGVSRHYLETTKQIDTDTVSVNGNREGLIYLALSCLRLAEKGLNGSHQHFDEAGMVDRAEVDLVVGYTIPDWDSKKSP